jgi:Domain of unknown function (DUF1707)
MDEAARRYQPGTMRASDADRDAVLAELSGHFQVGRLTLAEFDERSDLALHARTYGELADLTRDLPPAPARPPAPTPQPEARHAGPRLPVAAVAAALVLVVLVVATVTRDAVVGIAFVHLWWLVILVPLIAGRAGRGRR